MKIIVPVVNAINKSTELSSLCVKAVMFCRGVISLNEEVMLVLVAVAFVVAIVAVVMVIVVAVPILVVVALARTVVLGVTVTLFTAGEVVVVVVVVLLVGMGVGVGVIVIAVVGVKAVAVVGVVWVTVVVVVAVLAAALQTGWLAPSSLPVNLLKYQCPLQREQPPGAPAKFSRCTLEALGSRAALALAHSSIVANMVSKLHALLGC